MRKTIYFVWLIMIVLPCAVAPDELYFPNTEAEIVEALGHENAKTITTPSGIKYVAEKGRVYKIINGKRYTLRGIQVVEAMEILPKAGALINFDFDSANISADSFPLLNEFGKALKNGLPDAVILISGHTDSKGSFEYNQNLSELRAEAVVAYLKGYHGIEPKRLLKKGFGETQPIAENNTEENRFKNRRVEFVRVK